MPPGRKTWMTDWAGASFLLPTFFAVGGAAASRRKKSPRLRPRPPRNPTCRKARRLGRRKCAGSSCQVTILLMERGLLVKVGPHGAGVNGIGLGQKACL